MFLCRKPPPEPPSGPRCLYVQFQHAFDAGRKDFTFRDSVEDFRIAADMFASKNPGFRVYALCGHPKNPWTATFERDFPITPAAESLVELFNREHRSGVSVFVFSEESHRDIVVATIHFETENPGYRIRLIKYDDVWRAAIEKKGRVRG